MSFEKKSKEELEKLIDQAIQKIQGSKEKDLCKYIPGPTGGYMHHFTLRKLKQTDPTQLVNLLKNFILNQSKPSALKPKSRAPRGSRKQPDLIKFSRNDMEKILELAKQAGDADLLARFNPQRTLAVLKKELIRSIRNHQVNHDLWNAFAHAIQTTDNSLT